MIRKSLNNQILKSVISILIISTGIFYFITYNNIEQKIDEDQFFLYNKSIETKIFLLEEKYNRLEDTHFVESYERVFKDGILELFRKMYYDKNLEIYPYIIDVKKKIYLLHPKYNENNKKEYEDSEIFKKSIAIKDGEFNLSNENNDKWVIVQNFKQWDWIIGYSVPFDIKYNSLYAFQKNFIVMTIFLLLIASLLVWISIRKLLNPINQLIVESKKIKDGNLDSKISINANYELSELSNNFISMRNSVKTNINELNNTKELLKNIIDSAPIRIFWKDKEGRFSGANKLFLEDFGNIKIEDLLGKTDIDFNVKEAKQYMDDDLKIMDEKICKLNFTETQNFEDKDEMIISTSKVPLKDLKGDVIGILGVYNDITEQVKLQNDIQEKELFIIHQTKLASMGEMIGNISHQWRQPLSVISTAATGLLLQKRFDTLNDDFFLDTCKLIDDNAQYLSKTIDDFKNFIRNDRDKVLFDLTENINSFLNLVSSSVKDNDLNIVSNIDNNIKLRGYPNELIQCFMNIFNNAKDALNDTRITKYIFVTTKVIEDKVIIIFKDNAGGIPNDIIGKIFDPYFTTKHKSQGTGLGLSMSYSMIVEGMDGLLEVENVTYSYDNNNYVGAQFTITLNHNVEIN